jgi:GT2 family glycosyltransferase
MTKPGFSIVIPFHKNADMLYLSLYTLSESINDLNVEIIVVANNACSNEIDLYLPESYRLIQVNENIFYPKAVNLGAEYAHNKYLVLCDPDIFYSQGWLLSLYKTFIEHKNTGCVGAKLINPINNRVMDYGCGFKGAHSAHYGRGLLYNHTYLEQDKETSCFCGAILFCEKDMYDQLGGMDISMPYAFCDYDFTLRISEQKLQNYVSGDAIVYHKSYIDPNNSKYYSFSYLREDSVVAFYRKHTTLPDTYATNLSTFFEWHKVNGINFEKEYLLINFSTVIDWREYIADIEALGFVCLDICSCTVRERYVQRLDLPDLLNKKYIGLKTALLYFVDNFTSLFGNSLWFSLRHNNDDIVIDRDGNIIPIYQIINYIV